MFVITICFATPFISTQLINKLFNALIPIENSGPLVCPLSIYVYNVLFIPYFVYYAAEFAEH